MPPGRPAPPTGLARRATRRGRPTGPPPGARRGPREIAAANVFTAVRDYLGRQTRPEPEMTPAARQSIARLYRADFLRFGYQPSAGTATVTAKTEAGAP